MKSITLCLVAVSAVVLLVNEVSCNSERLAALEEDNFGVVSDRFSRNATDADSDPADYEIYSLDDELSGRMREAVGKLRESKVFKELDELGGGIYEDLVPVGRELASAFKTITEAVTVQNDVQDDEADG